MSEAGKLLRGHDVPPSSWPLAQYSGHRQVGGVMWHYQHIKELGSLANSAARPKLLLIHGTGASTHSWAPLVDYLRPDWDCLLVDLPGHGFSGPMTLGAPTLPAVAAALTALLDALVFKPQVIAGHSAGAAIAVQMALAGCHTRQIVSLNGAFLPFGSLAAPLFSKAAGWLARARFFQHTTALHGYFRRPITKLLAETGSHPTEQMIRAYQVLMRRPNHIRGTLEMMAAWNLQPLRAQLPKLAVPVELIVCCNDKTVSPSQSTRLSELVHDAHISELEQLGHLGHEECPRLFVPVFEQIGMRVKR